MSLRRDYVTVTGQSGRVVDGGKLWWVVLLWQITGWKQCMSYPVELHGVNDTLAFPPRPPSAEVAVHGLWCRRPEVQKGRGHGLVPQNVHYELTCRGGWLKKSHLQSQNLLDLIGLMETCRGPRVSHALVGAACQHSPMSVQESKALLMWRIRVWSQLHQLCPGCQACYGRNARFQQCCSRFMGFSRELSMQASAVFTEWKMVWREHKSPG